MRQLMLVCVVSMVAVTSAQTDWLGGTPGGEPTEFVVLAGPWRVAQDGTERILKLDASAWKTGTPPERLTEKARALFPATAAEFEARVRAGLQFPYGVVRSVDRFERGELQVDFRLVAGASDQFASLLFGLTPDGNHLAFRYNTKDGDTALWKVVNGQRERIHSGGVHVDVKLGEWRTLRMRLDGAQVTGWVDNVQALSHTLTMPAVGKVGLWSKADSVTDYRRFIVKR